MRIIAGQLRGRKLKAPSGMHTRPTLDRVREALFSILGNLRDLRVIDAYAGTGALGIEALSRGAAHASFVENDSAASAVLRDNLETLGVSDRATLIQSSMEKPQQRGIAMGKAAMSYCEEKKPPNHTNPLYIIQFLDLSA